MACEKLEMIYFLVVISFMLKYVSTNDTLYVLGNYKTKYDALHLFHKYFTYCLILKFY